MTSRTRRGLAVVAVTLLAVAGATACLRERVCLEGERPVRSVEAPKDGRACTEDGVVPEGFETFPPGQEPTEVYVG